MLKGIVHSTNQTVNGTIGLSPYILYQFFEKCQFFLLKILF